MKFMIPITMLFILSGCVSNDEIQELRLRNDALQKELEDTKKEVENLQIQIDALSSSQNQIPSALDNLIMQRGEIYDSFEELMKAVPGCMSAQHDCNYCGIDNGKVMLCTSSICTPGSYTPGWSCDVEMMR